MDLVGQIQATVGFGVVSAAYVMGIVVVVDQSKITMAVRGHLSVACGSFEGVALCHLGEVAYFPCLVSEIVE